MKKRLIKAIALLITVCAAMLILSGCESKSVTEEDVLERVQPGEDFVLEGSWQDETSQRATMDITKADAKDEYNVLISWGASADESISWQMSGTFDTEGGLLSYKNCVKTVHKFDEDGNEDAKVEYKDGEGAIMYLDGKLTWDDKKVKESKDCSFVKVETAAAE